MVQIHSLLLEGEIPVNCYIVSNKQECFVIDPGYQKNRIRNFVSDCGFVVRGILLTHAHIDHIEALDCFDVPVYLHEAEYPILMSSLNNGFHFFGKQPQYDMLSLNVVTIDEAWSIPLGDQTISVIHTPGHTIGSVCYKIGHNLFSGDTLFAGSVGKWDRPSGNMEVLKQTIVQLVKSLPEYVRVYPAHGSASTIGVEKHHNPFYLNWSRNS